MARSFQLIDALVCAAAAAAVSIPAFAQDARPPSGLSANDLTALCARVGLRPPVSLGVLFAPPKDGATRDEVRAYCARLGFRRGAPPAPAEVFQAADKNNDGKLDGSELRGLQDGYRDAASDGEGLFGVAGVNFDAGLNPRGAGLEPSLILIDSSPSDN